VRALAGQEAVQVGGESKDFAGRHARVLLAGRRECPGPVQGARQGVCGPPSPIGWPPTTAMRITSLPLASFLPSFLLLLFNWIIHSFSLHPFLKYERREQGRRNMRMIIIITRDCCRSKEGHLWWSHFLLPSLSLSAAHCRLLP